jgi:hypothetical protein
MQRPCARCRMPLVDEELNKVRAGAVGVPAAMGAIKARANELLKGSP